MAGRLSVRDATCTAISDTPASPYPFVFLAAPLPTRFVSTIFVAARPGAAFPLPSHEGPDACDAAITASFLHRPRFLGASGAVAARSCRIFIFLRRAHIWPLAALDLHVAAGMRLVNAHRGRPFIFPVRWQWVQAGMRLFRGWHMWPRKNNGPPWQQEPKARHMLYIISTVAF